MRVLIVDAANVVGSRPTGWWRDRAGAAGRLHDALSRADLEYDETVLVLEGRAREGHSCGLEGRLRTVRAPNSGDDAIVAETRRVIAAGDEPVVVTADRELRQRVAAAGASSVGPSWLLERL